MKIIILFIVFITLIKTKYAQVQTKIYTQGE